MSQQSKFIVPPVESISAGSLTIVFLNPEKLDPEGGLDNVPDGKIALTHRETGEYAYLLYRTKQVNQRDGGVREFDMTYLLDQLKNQLATVIDQIPQMGLPSLPSHRSPGSFGAQYGRPGALLGGAANVPAMVPPTPEELRAAQLAEIVQECYSDASYQPRRGFTFSYRDEQNGSIHIGLGRTLSVAMSRSATDRELNGHTLYGRQPMLQGTAHFGLVDYHFIVYSGNRHDTDDVLLDFMRKVVRSELVRAEITKLFAEAMPFAEPPTLKFAV